MTIPFKLVVGIMLIDANVNGREGHLAFDTGALQTTLNTRYFKGSETSNTAYTYDVNEHDNMEANSCQNLSSKIEIGDLSFSNDNTPAIDMSYIENPLKGIDEDVVFLARLELIILRIMILQSIMRRELLFLTKSMKQMA